MYLTWASTDSSLSYIFAEFTQWANHLPWFLLLVLPFRLWVLPCSPNLQSQPKQQGTPPHSAMNQEKVWPVYGLLWEVPLLPLLGGDQEGSESLIFIPAGTEQCFHGFYSLFRILGFCKPFDSWSSLHPTLRVVQGLPSALMWIPQCCKLWAFCMWDKRYYR